MKYFTKEELEDITKELIENPTRETLKNLNDKYNGNSGTKQVLTDNTSTTSSLVNAPLPNAQINRQHITTNLVKWTSFCFIVLSVNNYG